MRHLAPIAPVLLGVSLAQVALGLMATLIPLLMLRDGVSAEVIGLVASAYYLGFLAGALSASRLVAEFGHIRAFAALAAAACMTAEVLVFTSDPVPVAAIRAVMGYASSGLFLIAESWLNDRADQTTRGRFFGAYMVVNWSASALGPFLLRYTPPQETLFALVGAGFAAALLPMALTHQANPVIKAGSGISLRRLFAISPVGLVCALAAGLLNSSYYALMPVYLGRHGLGAAEISSFASVVMVAALASQYPLGLLADRVERRRLTVAMLGLALAAALGLVLLGGSSLVLIAGFGSVVGASMSPLYGLGAGQTNDRLERGDYVAAAGGLLFVWSLGAAVGPTLAGLLMGPFGAAGLFVYLCTAMALVAGFVLWRMRAREDVPMARQSGFVPGGTVPPRLPTPPVQRGG